jgi:hypothetical protein
VRTMNIVDRFWRFVLLILLLAAGSSPVIAQSACKRCSETWAQCMHSAQTQFSACNGSVEPECRVKCKDDRGCYRLCIGESRCQARFNYDGTACRNELERCKRANCRMTPGR